MKRFIHFIGAHRNGSATLAYFFGRNCHFYSVHQTVWHLTSNIMGNLKVAGLLPDFLLTKYVSVLVKYLEKKSLKYSGIVETNGFNLFILPELIRAFPHIRVVHLVREPHSMVPSMIRKRKHNYVKRFLQLNLPLWQITPKLAGCGESIRSLSEKDLIFWQWAFKNQYLLDSLSHFDHYKLVFFEDLFSESRKAYDETMKFCELELFEDCFDELVATRRNSSTPNLVDTSEMSVDDPAVAEFVSQVSIRIQKLKIEQAVIRSAKSC